MIFPPFSKKALSIPPYPEAERKEGTIRLSSNENPFGFPSSVKDAIAYSVSNLNRYPDNNFMMPKKILAEKFSLSPDYFIFGKGSNEVIELVCKAFLEGGERVIVTDPCFPMYVNYSLLYGADIVKVPLKDFRVDISSILKIIKNSKILFLNSPLNPTGTIIKKDELKAVLDVSVGRCVVLLDEAYVEFVDEDLSYNSVEFIKEGYPLVIARTFSKAYGLAGLRVGYGIADPEVISVMERTKQPYNLGIIEEKAVEEALKNEDFVEKTVEEIKKERRRMELALSEKGIGYVKSQGNFMLIHLGRNAQDIYRKLASEGIYTRYMGAYGYPEYIRVTIGREEENNKFLKALFKIISSELHKG